MSATSGKSGQGNLILAGVMVLATVPLLFISQPDWAEKFEHMTDKQQKLADREVYIDPGELLATMNDDLVNLILIDVRDESSWNRFHFKDAQRIPLEKLPDKAKGLRTLPSNSVIVLVCNDEIKATEGWKMLTALGVLNTYILEGGINHWLDVYGHAPADHPASSKTDGTLRHELPGALGDRHPAAHPDAHHAPVREFEPKIKIVKKVRKSQGCG